MDMNSTDPPPSISDSAAADPSTFDASPEHPPLRRPWWRLSWATWFCLLLVTASGLFLNFGWAGAGWFESVGPMPHGYYDIGWPAPFFSWGDYGDDSINKQLPFHLHSTGSNILRWTDGDDSINKQLPFHLGRLLFDSTFWLLAIISSAIVIQTAGARYPGLLRLTLWQVPAIAAFLTIFLLASDEKRGSLGDTSFTLKKLWRLTHEGCGLLAYAVLAVSAFLLSHPPWWQLPMRSEDQQRQAEQHSPVIRSWRKVSPISWLAMFVTFCCLIFLNIGWPLASFLPHNGDMPYNANDIGWPAVFAHTIPFAFVPAAWQKFLTDAGLGLLMLGCTMVLVETTQRRHPELLRFSIAQCLGMTAFVAFFLVACGFEMAWDSTERLQRICAYAGIVARAIVFGVLALGLLVVARIRWWRRGGEPGKL